MDVVFKRNKEIQQLLRFRGNGKIKVIEGLRQVGKSFPLPVSIILSSIF